LRVSAVMRSGGFVDVFTIRISMLVIATICAAAGSVRTARTPRRRGHHAGGEGLRAFGPGAPGSLR